MRIKLLDSATCKNFAKFWLNSIREGAIDAGPGGTVVDGADGRIVLTAQGFKTVENDVEIGAPRHVHAGGHFRGEIRVLEESEVVHIERSIRLLFASVPQQ